MMSRNLEQGIQALQGGYREEAARLIHLALRDDPMPPQTRAIALMWLAETTDDASYKVSCYQQAAQADPANQDIGLRLQYWQAQLGAQAPTAPVAPAPQQNTRQVAPSQAASIQIQTVQNSVGIIDVPGGRGSGFFVSQNGLIATTRTLVGSDERVTVMLADGRQLEGRVVRSFPLLDLALVQVNAGVQQLLPIASSLAIEDDTPLIAVVHPDSGIRASKRSTRHATAPYWIPTLFKEMPDGGGNPIFNAQNRLVGMLTRNALRTTPYLYGLHIHQIMESVEQYGQELQQVSGRNSVYCYTCGNISLAPAYGGSYCEVCGTTLPYAAEIQRRPDPATAALYSNPNSSPCPNCGVQAGFYRNACLRCGYAPEDNQNV
jgi:hypothetical protein